MNESVRALSVLAERIAPNLLGDYVKIILQNAQKYQTTPFTLNVAGVPVEVMPADLLIDTNVRVKTLVDQDFRPAKLAREREALMIMGSMPPPPGKKWNPGPVMEDYLKTLDVPHYDQVIQDMTEEDMAQIALMNQLGAEKGSGSVTSGPASAEGSDTLNTPAGPVMAAPGDQKGTTQAVRSSSV
jgi:hypothetical protein